MSSISIIIPARWDSTRFPGKPLAKIVGKEMILHVADGCAPAFGKDVVYVVTDDDRIAEVVTKAGYKCIMTKNDQDFQTGTDRVAYAAGFLDSEYIINVQGDEPLVDYRDIKMVYKRCRKYKYSVINCYKKCKKNDGLFENKNTIKVIVNEPKWKSIEEIISLNYMSRQPIPTYGEAYNRQVCIYGFCNCDLKELYGEDFKKEDIEKNEDVEFLRIMIHKHVIMVEVTGEYQSVDVPDDIEKVERILNGKTS